MGCRVSLGPFPQQRKLSFAFQKCVCVCIYIHIYIYIYIHTWRCFQLKIVFDTLGSGRLSIVVELFKVSHPHFKSPYKHCENASLYSGGGGGGIKWRWKMAVVTCAGTSTKTAWSCIRGAGKVWRSFNISCPHPCIVATWTCEQAWCEDYQKTSSHTGVILFGLSHEMSK